MNSGPIIYRYAKALLKYVQELGSGDRVYSQAQILVHMMNKVPQIVHYITDAPDISQEQTVSWLSTALNEPLDSALVDFLKMLSANRRKEYFPRMLWAFIEQYRQENNIKVGSLVTATEIAGLRESLEDQFSENSGAVVFLEEKIDPDILGGFILEMDGYRLDASVESYLARIRSQLVESNNRIV